MDFDRSRHLSEVQIAKRAEERRQIETERLRQEEEELNIKFVDATILKITHLFRRQEELKVKQELDDKDRRREDRERKRREKVHLKRFKKS